MLLLTTRAVHAEDLDANGVLDNHEQGLIEKFCPTLVMGKSDIAVGDVRAIQVCPEPVEMLINNLWLEVANQEGQLRGSYKSESYTMYDGLFYMNRSWMYDYTMPAPCGSVLEGTKRFHFDFGGTGCDDFGGNGESGHSNDQPAGWGKVYADGNQYTQSGINFAHTVYAHIYGLTGDARVIQYWFYYPYNDWVSDHEGDWEHIDVHITSPDTAVAVIDKVVFYFHEKYWTANTIQTDVQPGQPFDCYIMDGSHPVVFVGGKWSKTYEELPGPPTHGSGPGSHGSYPIRGQWPSVVEAKKHGIHAFWLDDVAEGEGLFIPWNLFVDGDPSDHDGVVLIKNYIHYNPETEPHMGWLKSSTWWGHPKVKSFGSDFEYAIAYGNEAPNGPARQETWEHSDEDTGRFHRYSGLPTGISYVSDVEWTPPATIAVTSPDQSDSVSNVLTIKGIVHYADAISIAYGAGSNPTTWGTKGITPSWSSDEIGREVAVGSWNTGTVPSGMYTIRVRAIYGAQTFDVFRTVSVQHKTITVASSGGDFTTIQAAIDAAEMGDEIRVKPSGPTTVHTGKITMRETIPLIADGPGIVLKRGSGTGAVVEVNGGFYTILDGFTITHEHPISSSAVYPSDYGLKIINANPIIRNCTFKENRATSGAGALITGSSSPIFERCTFADNVASADGGGIAINSGLNSTVTFDSCIFIGNQARTSSGSAVSMRPVECCAGSGPTYVFEACQFLDNGLPITDIATLNIGDNSYAPTIVQFSGSLFARNDDKILLNLALNAAAEFTNCTIAANECVDGVLSSVLGYAILGRSIIAKNSGPLHLTSSTASIELGACVLFENIDQGRGVTDEVWAGTGEQNYWEDPSFCDAANGNYRLYAFSPAAPGANGEVGPYFSEKVGAFDVGCVPGATVTVATGDDISNIPGAPLLVCPKGEAGMDHLVITVEFDDEVVRRPLNANEISIQPPYLTNGIVSATTVRGSESSGNTVTIDHPNFSGYGVNREITLYLNGHALEQKALLTHRSPDMKTAGSGGGCAGDISCPDGIVGLADFNWFSTHYPTTGNPGAPYFDGADFKIFPEPAPLAVSLADYNVFSIHYAGQGHRYEGGTPLQTFGVQEVASTHVDLDFTEEFVTALDHRLYVDVTLKDCADKNWCLFAIRPNRSDVAFVSWEPTSWAASSAPMAPVDTEDGLEFYFGVIMWNDTEESTRHLGRLVFAVDDSDLVTIADSEFILACGDVGIASEQSGEALFVGEQTLFARMSGVTGRALNQAVQQVFHNRLEQNFPNPFNPQTTLAYSLKDASDVSLAIYDVAGRRVRDLINERRKPGAYKVVWDGRDGKGTQVASGVYFYKLIAGSFVDTKKMIMLK